MLRHGILGLLNYGDMTGYEIRETFRDSLAFFWKAQNSQIYRELHTLEQQGWIRMTTVEQIGKPDKNVCHITPEGKTELLRWLNEDGAALTMRIPLLMRVFFFGNRSREENIAYFRRFAAECQAYMDSFEPVDGIIGSYETQLDVPEHGLYWQMTVDFGRRSLQCYMDWAHRCVELLEQRESMDQDRGGVE